MQLYSHHIMFSVVNWSFAFRVYAMMIDNEGNLYKGLQALRHTQV